MASRIIFRKIRGRIVPIVKSVADKIKSNPKSGEYAIYGTAGGAVAGSLAAAAANQKDLKEVRSVIRDKRGRVDSKKFAKASGVKGVTVITSMRDLDRNKSLDRRAKRLIRRHAKTAFSQENAFALRRKGKDYVFVSPKSNPSVLGHELGHIKDYQKGKGKQFYNKGTIGTLTGNTYRTETRAWKLSPAKTQKGKAAALRTYKRDRDYTRAGTGLGLVGGLGLAVLTRGRM